MIVGEPVLSTFLNKWKTQLTSEIQEVKHSRERFLDLLLIADPSEKIVQQYLPKGHLFAFLNEGEAIGVVHLIHTSGTVMEVKNIAVKEEEQGNGYGKRLLQFALNFCTQQG